MTKKKENSTSDGYFSKNHKKRFNKKVFFIAIVTVAAILVAGGATFLIINSNNNDGDNSTNQSKTTITQEQIQKYDSEVAKISKDASKLVDQGDTGGAKEIYSQAIEESINDYEKAILLIGQSLIHYNLSEYDNALEIALESESLYKSDRVASLIADIYLQMNDKKNAILYYNKAIQYNSSEQNFTYEDDNRYYNDMINSLEE
ncbi:MAG: hypothetical protein WBI29_01045 [Candidatus Saccharimonadales bacterium]